MTDAAEQILVRSFASNASEGSRSRRFLSLPNNDNPLGEPLLKDIKSKSFVASSSDSFLDDATQTFTPSHRDSSKCIPFILSNEACERFAYYGLSSLLTVYYKNSVGWPKGTAAAVYNYFTSVAYLTPLLGGYMADSIWGKYFTIISFSSVYVVGMALLSFSTIANTIWLGFLGLALTALGTGGIKPCVSSFGGDQFEPHEEKKRESFFQYFYFTINFGSVFSFIVCPLLRDNLGDFVAFGVPAVLMALAIVLFIVGNYAVGYKKTPPEGSVLAHVFRLCSAALSHRSVLRGDQHWLDGALVKYTKEEVEEVKSVFRIFPVFCALPVFWCLFNQTGGQFVTQAEAMDRHFGSFVLSPASTGVVNPIIIMLFIPIFDKYIYRLFPNFKHLDRMIVGMIFTFFACCCGTAVAFAVDGGANLHWLWQTPQIILLSIAEILISISGLEFSYAQAPPTMKSTITSIYLLTNSVGSLLGGLLSQFVEGNMFWIVSTALIACNIVAMYLVASWFKKAEKKQALVDPNLFAAA